MRMQMHNGNTGEAGNARPSLREWFDGLWRALPGDEFLLSPSSCELTAIIDPAGKMKASASLGCSNDSQDHTLWAVRVQRRSSARRIFRSRGATRPATTCAPDAIRVHRNPAHVRDDGRPSLFDRTRMTNQYCKSELL